MEKFLTTIRLLAVLIPILIEAIRSVEAAMPEPGAGKQKLEIVRTMVEESFAQFTEVTVAFTDVWPILSKLTTTIVASFNALGIFKK